MKKKRAYLKPQLELLLLDVKDVLEGSGEYETGFDYPNDGWLD